MNKSLQEELQTYHSQLHQAIEQDNPRQIVYSLLDLQNIPPREDKVDGIPVLDSTARDEVLDTIEGLLKDYHSKKVNSVKDFLDLVERYDEALGEMKENTFFGQSYLFYSTQEIITRLGIANIVQGFRERDKDYRPFLEVLFPHEMGMIKDGDLTRIYEEIRQLREDEFRGKDLPQRERNIFRVLTWNYSFTQDYDYFAR